MAAGSKSHCHCTLPVNSFIVFCVLIFASIYCGFPYPLFTQERFRASYTPNTTPEETFDAWEPDDVPNPPTYVNETEVLQKHLVVKSYLREWNENQGSVAAVIRCPNGWVPIGPFCTSISAVPPYTQCPMDLKLYYIGPGNPVIPLGPFAGLCQRHEFTGLTFDCPPGFKLVRSNDGEESDATATNGDGYQNADDSDDDDDDSARPRASYYCEFVPGSSIDTKDPGQRLPPEPACPSGFDLNSNVVNVYAFYGRQRLECAATTKIKGKLLCPQGYGLSGEFFPNLPFGTVISNNQTLQVPPFELSAEGQSFVENSEMYQSGLKPFDSPACFKALNVLSRNCNKLQCSTPFLRQLRHVLINWGYRLQLDPDSMVYAGIPSGRDFRFTKTGARQEHNK